MLDTVKEELAELSEPGPFLVANKVFTFWPFFTVTIAFGNFNLLVVIRYH
jgi:hypothetical protein